MYSQIMSPKKSNPLFLLSIVAFDENCRQYEAKQDSVHEEFKNLARQKKCNWAKLSNSSLCYQFLR